MVGAKPLRIRLDKIDETRYLVLFGLDIYDSNCNRIRCLINQKSGVTYVFSYFYAKIKVDSYDSLSIEKTLALLNVIIHIKSFLNKDQNHYYYNIFLEKYSKK